MKHEINHINRKDSASKTPKIRLIEELSWEDTEKAIVELKAEFSKIHETPDKEKTETQLKILHMLRKEASKIGDHRYSMLIKQNARVKLLFDSVNDIDELVRCKTCNRVFYVGSCGCDSKLRKQNV